MWHGNSKEENEILYTRFLKNKIFSDSMVNATSAKFAVPKDKKTCKKAWATSSPKNNISENTAKILNINYTTAL